MIAELSVLPHTLLRLGRVSNLPTVWTNVLAATLLAGGAWQNARIGLVLSAMSLVARPETRIAPCSGRVAPVTRFTNTSAIV